MSTTRAEQAREGLDLHSLATELFPICRSITGDGVRRTLDIIGRGIPLEITEVPSGTRVFDWEVPNEWNIEDAWIEDPQGDRIVDFQQHNLHLVSYSEPVRMSLGLDDLDRRLHSLPERPEWIPYRTSYYERNWGFCLRHEDREALKPGRYEVEVRSDLSPGSLTYGECFLPGKSRREVLLFTHVCHPSLANDNASGMAMLTKVAHWLSSASRRFSYRIVFAPGTIGSLCWLKNNERRLERISYGLVLGLLGDPGPLTYKSSRRGEFEVDRIVPYALRDMGVDHRVVPFEPYGYDERQFCSPGFDLPVGRLTRSANGEYAQYHSSADDLSLIEAGKLEQSFDAVRSILRTIELNSRYRNMAKGEPRLGKRGLYGSVGGKAPAESERAMLWVLNQSDGSKSLVDIAERSRLGFDAIKSAADRLAAGGLLDPEEEDV